MTRLSKFGLAGGVLAIFLLAAQNANGSVLAFSLHVQFALLVAGIAGIALGLSESSPPDARDNRTTGLILAITGLALIVRLWQLETSVHYFVDELNFAEGVNDIFRAGQTGETLRLLHPMHWLAAFPRIYPYWQSLTVMLAGHNLTGLRLVSVILGTLTVPAVYCAGRNLFDRKTGILAALLLATFPAHVHFSRLGLNNVADPLFATLAIAYLARGMREGRRGDFALAGVLLGLTQYFYEGGRLVYPAAIGLWLVFRWMRPRPGQVISPRNLAVFVLAAGLVALPYYSVAITYHLGLTPRLGSKGLSADYWQTLFLSPGADLILAHLRHMLDAFVIYGFLPDRSFYYGGTLPVVLPYLVPALLAGIMVVLRRGGRVLLLILLLASLGNSFLRESAWASGFVVTFPALCLLIAVGLRAFWRWLRPYFPARQGITTSIVVLLCAGQLVYYFAFHLDVYNRQIRTSADGQDAIFRALDLPPNTHVHLVGDIIFYEFDIDRMQAYLGRADLQTDVVFPVNFTSDYLRALLDDAPQAFFLEHGAADELTLLKQFFDVQPALTSPYNVPPERQFDLYLATRRKN